ncbi:hypothetical protein SEA_SWITZERLAND_75 [Gordonia phage Switzerland]|nr:hypothetical protein SEA_SHAYRA_76 [Gordonia phage ShayRa]QWS67856.1 hypothetical protein SEA_DEKHOCKEY33_77 [Gordonia phage DekHockey33]UOK18127.1 hypothetical protein SEA_SWITZERLAND_75 [Gordonia phage Switzerland]
MSDTIPAGEYVVTGPAIFGRNDSDADLKVGDTFLLEDPQAPDRDGDVFVDDDARGVHGYIRSTSIELLDPKAVIKAKISDIQKRIESLEEQLDQLETPEPDPIIPVTVTSDGLYRVGNRGYLVTNGTQVLYTNEHGAWISVPKGLYDDEITKKIDLIDLARL